MITMTMITIIVIIINIIGCKTYGIIRRVCNKKHTKQINTDLTYDYFMDMELRLADKCVNIIEEHNTNQG